ncbi:MAG: ABC transporter substrate-binding protein [Rhodospirillales bacterium]|nr:ABC transporter substrate-binding protein [Rhodospirillales bacterium]
MRRLVAVFAVFLISMTGARAAEVAGAHGVAMHGTLKYPAGFTHFDYVNPDAPKGGMVRLGAQGTFDSFNSFIVKGNPAAGLGFIYDNLMASSADEAFTEYGLLAESVSMPEDRSWVAFTLRKEARWHDGKPVTVEDVIWTFNTLITKGSPFYRFYYGNVSEVVKTGERTVRFNFKPGENRELPLIIGQFTILPKHYWEGREFDKTTLEPPLGSGPYKIEKFEAGRAITFKRVEDWWGKDLAVNKGQYNFDRIRYDYYRDGTIALEAFKAGEFDYRAENSSKSWATAYKIPYVDEGLIKLEEISHDRSSGMQGYVFNTRRSLFKDRAVREALAYAFDFEWSNKNLFYGQYTRTRSYFDNSELAATGLPGPDEMAILEPFRGRIPDEVFTTEYNPPKNETPGKIRANLRTASKILTDAGWVIKDKRRVNAETGQELAFEILLNSPISERIVLPYAKNLERLGVTATVRTIDTSQYQRRMDTHDFDMVIGGFGQSLSPGNEQRDFWGSQAADIEGGRNIIGIKDPVIDELIEKIIAAPDRKQLVTTVKALDRVLQWGHWLVPNFHSTYDRIAYWNKFGRPDITPIQGNQFLAWWVDPAKENLLKSKLSSAQ